MKASEATDLARMLKSATGGRADADTVALFESQLERLDADSATQAVLAGVQTWKWFPSWAEFMELYRAQRKLSEPDRARELPDGPPPEPARAMPQWLKRYACARFLYARFGRDQDMRTFAEQRGHVDPTAPAMPADEWVTEAESVSDREAWRAVLGMGS